MTATARRNIVRCCRRLREAGLIAGQDGNVSCRLGASRVLVTPAGLFKGEISARDIVEVTLAGRRVRGHRSPSSELDMHLRIYRRRADVGAVVHAHPPTATGFAVAGETLDHDVLPEIIFQLGRVPLVPFALPGTTALGDQMEPLLDGHDVLLLANHGAVAMGATVNEARMRMESLEQAAKILLAARALGRVTRLPAAAVAALDAARARR